MPLIPANLKKWFRPVVSNLEETKDDFVQPRRNGELPFNRLSSILPYTAYDEDNAVFVIEGEDSGKIEGCPDHRVHELIENWRAEHLNLKSGTLRNRRRK